MVCQFGVGEVGGVCVECCVRRGGKCLQMKTDFD